MTQSRQSRAEGLAIGRFILNYTTIAIALMALVGVLCHACAHGEDLPDAPTARAASPVLRSLGMQPIVKRPFLHNRADLGFIGADVIARVVLDPISTRQFMTNPCRCFAERGDLLLGLIPWRSAANSFVGQATFGAVSAGAAVGESWLLWRFAESGNAYSWRAHHRRAMELASRMPLAYDAGSNLAHGFIHNEMLIGGAR